MGPHAQAGAQNERRENALFAGRFRIIFMEMSIEEGEDGHTFLFRALFK
jgi:hypothetical protein